MVTNCNVFHSPIEMTPYDTINIVGIRTYICKSLGQFNAITTPIVKSGQYDTIRKITVH